ncbi:MAG TPA: NAD/NADP octopine/nopaline dehydrogenase family protein [Steroidobacteraceae bacterium]|nr:NAD/NADP octopine/nopaline dehydrogenase family protein [Steroidobacteraceae bacterium]
MPRVAVIGNSARAIGAVCASDLALSGHEVRFAVFPEQKDQLPALRKAGGFTVEGDAKHLVSRKTGFARLDKVCDTTREALKDAGAVLIEVDMHQLEAKFREMIPKLAHGAVVHIQSHGYWPAARLTPLLRKAGRADVIVTEAPAPTHAARIDGTVVTPRGLRKGIRIATVPASRSGEALAVLKPLFPDFGAASSVLQTGLENLNLIVHPAMVLPNIGAMERAKLEGRKFGFYQEGVVPAAGVLGDALDAERKLVCEAYGVEHTPMAKAIEQYYGFRSDSFYEAMQNPVYKSFPPFQPDIWRDWESVDLPYAIVPCVQLAEQAGVAVPLHRGFAEILGVLLGVDPWRCGPSLADMDLQGAPEAVKRRVLGLK